MFSIAGSYILERVNMLAAHSNYGTRYNGIGAVQDVLNKCSPAPMAYRVLIPWLMRPFFKRDTDGLLEWNVKQAPMGYYTALKMILTAGALYSIWLAWGMEVAIISALILPLTFFYDYWDWASEMIGISLALTGNLALALAGAVVHGLSKETAFILPVVYGIAILPRLQTAEKAMYEPLILGGVVLLAWLTVRAWAGKHPLYCDRWMIGRNWQEIKHLFTYRPWWISSMACSILLTIACLGLGWTAGMSFIVPLIILAAGWSMAVGQETRVFASVVPWVAYGILRVF